MSNKKSSTTNSAAGANTGASIANAEDKYHSDLYAKNPREYLMNACDSYFNALNAGAIPEGKKLVEKTQNLGGMKCKIITSD